MNNQLTIKLPDEVAAALNQIVAEEGISPSDVVSVALTDYLFIRKFRLLRERLMAKSQKDYTDEDIFERVS